MPTIIPDQEEQQNDFEASTTPALPKTKEDILIPVVLLLVLAGLGAGMFFLHRGISQRAEELRPSDMPARGAPPAPRVAERSRPVPLPSIGTTANATARTAPVDAPDRAARQPQLPTGMVLIPAGEFVTGLDSAGNPVTAHLPAFFIDRYEVTNRQYHAFITDTGHPPPEGDIWRDGSYPPQLADHPVVNVSYRDATAYAEWAGRRLPTEDEWEKAARGQAAYPFPWGETADPVQGNFSDNPATDGTMPVGSFTGDASPYGVNDMGGNVREWTDTPYERGDRFTKVIKGGSFADRVGESSTFERRRSSLPRPDTGFRCAMDAR